MRAVVLPRPWTVHIRDDVPPPQPAAGWVVVRPKLVGICGSDLHAYTGTAPLVKYPVIPGHEFVGEVVKVLEGEHERWPAGRRAPQGLRPGLRVVADPAVPCGQCGPCRSGNYNVCVRQQVIGVHMDGAMAELVAVRADSLFIVPDHLSDLAAAMTEPLSIGLNACRRAKVSKGDSVIVIGAGMIGLAALMHALAMGGRCAVIEPLEWRREVAVEIGAEVGVHPNEADELRGWGTADGPEVVIEASGTEGGVANALRLAAPGGRVVVLGFWPQDLSLPATEITKKQLMVVGSRLHGGTVGPTLAALAAGELDVERLPVAVESVDRIEEIFSRLAKGETRAVKTLVTVAT